MKIGLQIVAFNWPGGPANIGTKLAEIAHTADEAGFASIWVMDHSIGGHWPRGHSSGSRALNRFRNCSAVIARSVVCDEAISAMIGKCGYQRRRLLRKKRSQ